jgi:clan AA aspartic protease (TIGR02281 family)
LAKIFISALTIALCVSQGLTASLPQPATPEVQNIAQELKLYAAPDDSSTVVGSIKKGEAFAPIIESIGERGSRWYLIKAANGMVGWVKKTSGDESRDLERFFKSLPFEPSIARTGEAPSEPAASAELAGAIRIPVQMNGAAVIVPVTLNRRLKASLVLDTGATTTMISHRLAASLGLRTDGPRIVAATANGNVAVPLARLGSIKVGEAEVVNLTVTVHDLSPAARADGLLGLDFLRRFHVSIDSKNQVLILAPR